MKVEEIRIDDYDYLLPDERIAKYPMAERDASKLLLYRNGEVGESRFSELARHLPQGAFLVFNNTKVIQARLRFRKETDAPVEIFCLEPHTPHDYVLIFQTTGVCRWLCLVGNSKRWKEGVLTREIRVGERLLTVTAQRITAGDQAHEVEFTWNDPLVNFADLLEEMGELPIPPYLNRATEVSDNETYQTVYSKIKGSVAAPTAGLHFTEEVFRSLEQSSVEWGELTLHVGAGTFRPVKAETIGEHEMHAETFSVGLSFLKRLRQRTGCVVAVGTTSVRTLESLYYIGGAIARNPSVELAEFKVRQWEPYRAAGVSAEGPELTAEEAIDAIIEYLERNNLTELHGSTRIIIAPGYRFKLVRGIITNFHQPRSTLLLLISAYLHGDWRKVYDYALDHDFRFLSYGDSSLLLH